MLNSKSSTEEKETFSPLNRDSTGQIDLTDKNLDETEDEKPVQFILSFGLTSAEAAKRLIEYGRNELEDKKTPKVNNSHLNIYIILFLVTSG